MAGSVAGLLQLQHSAGNAAVARLLGAQRPPTRTLQRLIGFELEAGEWRSALLDREPIDTEKSSGAISFDSATKPPDARQAFYRDGNISGTADELPGTQRDIEFVIEKRDEGDADAIGADFDKVDAAFKSMRSKLPSTSWLWPEKRLGWAPPDPGTWLISALTGEDKVQLQATAGMRLDEIAVLMASVGSPDQESEGETAESEEEPPANPVLAETSIHPLAGEILARSWAIAATAVLAFAKDRPTFATNNDRLIGFVALMTQIIDGGDVPTDEPEQARFAYPKAMAHILPRTDFANMFTTLPPEQQTALKADDPTATGQAALISLVREICTVAGAGGIDKPLLGWSKWTQIAHEQLVPDLTREAWVDGLILGQDRLSQSGYLAWLDSRKEALSPEAYATRKRQSKQLDSLGAWKHRMDPRGDEKLPLVEFRSLVRDVENKDMTVEEAKTIGLRLAAYLKRLAPPSDS